MRYICFEPLQHYRPKRKLTGPNKNVSAINVHLAQIKPKRTRVAQTTEVIAHSYFESILYTKDYRKRNPGQLIARVGGHNVVCLNPARPNK